LPFLLKKVFEFDTFVDTEFKRSDCMTTNTEFTVEKVYKKSTNEIFIITDPETQVQYIQTIVTGASGKSVALTPRIEPDGSIHYKE